jgi:hypothetical protein
MTVVVKLSGEWRAGGGLGSGTGLAGSRLAGTGWAGTSRAAIDWAGTALELAETRLATAD